MTVRRLMTFGTAMIAILAIGCAGTQMPNWQHPGPAGYQRYNALQYDPYPSDEAGPPTGTRPREYNREMPMAKWNERYSPRPSTVQPLSAKTFALPSLAPPPTTGAPVAAPTPVFPSARAPY